MLIVLATSCASMRAESDPPLRLTVSLRDGSTIIGTPDSAKIKIAAEFGDVAIKMSSLREVQLDAKKNAKLLFRNGDSLSGTWDAKRITIASMIGSIDILLTNITRIGIAAVPAKCVGLPALSTNGSWRIAKMDAGARGWATATVLKDGTVLIAGGHAGRDDQTATCCIFDPSTETFRQTDSMHARRHLHSATLLNDGRVLVVGGYNASQQWLADADIYDPAIGQWTATRPVFKHGLLHSATPLHDGRIFLMGGSIGSQQISSSAEFFNPGTDKWTPSRQHFEPRSSHSATELENGQIIIAGGANATEPVTTVIRYDPVTDSILDTDNMPAARANHSAVLLPDQRIMFACGDSSSGTMIETTLGDLGTKTWRPGPEISVGSIYHAGIPIGNGNLVVLGGSSVAAYGAPLNRVESYDAQKNEWIAWPKMNRARCVCSATVVLPDGRIAVFGGDDGTTGMDTYEIYTPGKTKLAK